MPQIGAPSLNPADIARQLQTLEAQKKSYDASHSAWLKGRDIRAVEDAAKKALEDAKRQAELIVKAAHDTVAGIEKDKKTIAELKAKAEGQLASLKAAQLEAEKAKVNFEQETMKLKAKQTMADEQYKKHCACEKEAKDKLDKIAAFLETINGHAH